MKLSELRPLIEYGLDREDLKKLIDSIKMGFITFEEFTNQAYILDDDYFYYEDDYVMTRSHGVRHIENTFFCDGYQEYICDSQTSYRVHEGRNEYTYSASYLNESETHYYYFDGEYYDDDAMDRYDLCWCEDEDEVRYRDNCYYHEGNGYYSYPPEDSTELYVREYHNGGYREILFDGRSPYRIGFEIEKEDSDVMRSIEIDDFESLTGNKWRKEKDGSLDEDCGYELVSPTFEFDIPKIFKHIEGNDVLVKHINAGISYNCGGHINLSKSGLDGDELFDKIKGYTPLLYALYHGRVNKNYCKGKKNSDIKGDGEKYQAIRIHSNRVEFRIISAVPSVSTLKWRCKLIKKILQYPTDDVARAYYYVDTKFKPLLKEVYSDERLEELKDRFIKFTKEFEDIDINKK